MTPQAFRSALEIYDGISEQLFHAFRGRRRTELRAALGRIKELVGPDAMPFVQVYVGVLDRKRQDVVNFGWIDVDYCNDGELFVLRHEAEPITFLTDGERTTLPAGQCPRCLGKWRIEPYAIRPCPKCGAELGRDVKVVLEGDACPLCEEPQGPSAVCGCGFDRDAAYAVRA